MPNPAIWSVCSDCGDGVSALWCLITDVPSLMSFEQCREVVLRSGLAAALVTDVSLIDVLLASGVCATVCYAACVVSSRYDR